MATTKQTANVDPVDAALDAAEPIEAASTPEQTEAAAPAAPAKKPRATRKPKTTAEQPAEAPAESKPEAKNQDILEQLDAATNPESAIADGAAPELGDKPAPQPKARKEVRRQQMAASRAREEQIAAMQIDLTQESSLRSAMNTSAIMHGTVAAVEDIYDPDDPAGEELLDVAIVVLLDKKTKVIIPFTQTFTYNPIDMSTVDLHTKDGRRRYNNRKRQFAEKMIRATVSFCLTGLERQGDIFYATGSRAKAMHIINRATFGSGRCREGDLGEATITAVSRHAVAVEFNGLDVVIPQYKLTLRYLRYVSDYYHIGDKLPVLVRKIEMGQDGRAVSAFLDPIACELQEAKDRYEMLRDGSCVKGIVTQVYRPEGKTNIYIYAWLPEWELPAQVLRINANDFGRAILAGTVMRLRVDSHDSVRGYLRCVPLSEHGNASSIAYMRSGR